MNYIGGALSRDDIPPDWGEGGLRAVSWGGIMQRGESGRTEDVYWIEEGSDAGPSDYARRAWVRGFEDNKDTRARRRRGGRERRTEDVKAQGEIPDAVNPGSVGSRRSRSNRRDRPSRNSSLSTLLPAAFLLPFLPVALAAPPRHLPRQTSTSPSPSPTSSPSTTSSAPGSRITNGIAPSVYSTAKRDVQYITSAAPPSSMPAEVVSVDETVLPYILSQGSDGYWTRNTDGWRLYGRQSGETPALVGDQPSSTQNSSYAVEEALPPGWGVQSTRTDFYRVPLIAVASCIIAVGIVVTIIIIAFKRRKAHRRAKRRAERQRRKELAAAGLTEGDVNDSNNQAQMREKLDDLQRQHRAKKKGDAAMVTSPSARSKVRNWRAGLRLRRKGGVGAEGEGEGEGAIISVIEEKPEENGHGQGERGSQDTDRSTPTVPSVEPGDESGSGSDGLFGSRLNTISSDDQTRSSSNSVPQIDGVSGGDLAGTATATATTTSAPYFPPAYRPASVRSMVIGRSSASAAGSRAAAGESSISRPNASPSSPTADGPTEKTRAPGYYPAPATAEGEIALAVASRSEGKARMPSTEVPDIDGDQREDGAPGHRAHVATDDKRVLERMRMAGSAPPDGQTGEDDGPSAPDVQVDEYGFEAIPMDHPASGPSAPPSMDMHRPTISHHPSLPLPPPHRPDFRRSYSVEREVHEQLDELNLLPSAPPVNAMRSHSLNVPVNTKLGPPVSASAPPLELATEDEPVPSAPPLHFDDEGVEDEDEDSGGDDFTARSGRMHVEDNDTPTAPPLHLTDPHDQSITAEAIDTSDDPDLPTTPSAPTSREIDAEAPVLASDAGSASHDDRAVHANDESRRPSEAPSENRVYLPRYEP